MSFQTTWTQVGNLEEENKFPSETYEMKHNQNAEE